MLEAVMSQTQGSAPGRNQSSRGSWNLYLPEVLRFRVRGNTSAEQIELKMKGKTPRSGFIFFGGGYDFGFLIWFGGFFLSEKGRMITGL